MTWNDLVGKTIASVDNDWLDLCVVRVIFTDGTRVVINTEPTKFPGVSQPSVASLLIEQ